MINGFIPTGMVSLHKFFIRALGEINGNNFYFNKGMVRVISLISTITVDLPVYMQEQACVRLDIRACKAEEIFQEFIEYLSHSQMLD